MLAGLPQAPSAYDPVQHLALAKQRQRQVLDQLVVNHILTAARSVAAVTCEQVSAVIRIDERPSLSLMTSSSTPSAYPIMAWPWRSV